MTRPVTRGAQGGESPLEKCSSPLEKLCWTSFKTFGHSSNILGLSQKTLRPSWCPTLVTGLFMTPKISQDKDSEVGHCFLWTVVIGTNIGKARFYKEMNFHPNVWSWNNMKTVIFSSTGADIANYLYSNVMYIFFAPDVHF